ncbi:MAG: hypothetical protein EBY20_07530 [Alphaproteobacteria bacterium]|nr:hypothetical protein [Alphaproteobacteria bacterium]
MKNISTLPLCQGGKNHDKINNCISHGTIELVTHDHYESTMPSLEEISVIKAKKALRKMLLSSKEAVQVFSNLEQLRQAVKISNERQVAKLPDNITELPKFHEAKTESLELPESAKETFARIVIRVREEFVEEQIERANFYNIPYETYGDNYYQLMQDIDQYEYLLKKAKDYCVDWDTSEYDPVALEQAIDEAEYNAYMHDQSLRSYFSSTRGLEV